MNKNIKQTLIGIAIGGIFLFLTLRNKPIGEIAESIKHANIFWMLMNGVCLLGVFYLRAMRWKVLINNIGHQAKPKDVVHSLTMGYFVNSFTPKLGEIIRCTSLSKAANIPLSKNFGTVVSERIYDLLVLGIGLLILLAIEFNRLKHILSGMFSNLSDLIFSNILISIIAVGAIIFSIVVFWWFFKKSVFYKKIKGFLKDIYQTVRMTFRLKKYWLFILLTILIWGTLVLMNYSCMLALPETDNYNIYFAVVVLFVGGLGWALPSPGGIGTTHFFILQLFLAFELSENAGVAYGVLSNGLTFVYTIVFGLIAIFLRFVYSGISGFSMKTEPNIKA